MLLHPMSSEELPAISARHLVSFYRQPYFPLATVCDYLAEGLSAGEAAFAAVTSEHAESIAVELKARGLPISDLMTDGRFACADASSTILYLLDPKITKREKDALMVQWVEESLGRAPSKRCRFLGEMVSLMVAEGNTDGAVDLEGSWNYLLANYPIMVYCTYEQTPFEKSPALRKFCDICNCHDGVMAAHLGPQTEKQSAWFVLLQEQASALREEVLRRRQAERLVFVNEANRLTQLEALLRVHGPNLSPMEKTDIVNVVSGLQTQARKEKRYATPESPEWHKKAGEILGYEKVIANVTRAVRKRSGDLNVS
ncbi:MAG TPA: MEDS domain-containing protein [Candidatus Acidoferrum sp.]|nr:MEDS domain-containing protein [Candidatus Acidoferrum sp.]